MDLNKNYKNNSYSQWIFNENNDLINPKNNEIYKKKKLLPYMIIINNYIINDSPLYDSQY